MSVSVLGVSHRSASAELLELLAFDAASLLEFSRDLYAHEAVDAVFTLSTCNRTEFYVSSKDAPAALAHLLERLNQVKGVDLRAGSDQSYYFRGISACRHLFRVACGIESMVVGECEILGQIRQAQEVAIAHGLSNEALSDLVMTAMEVGGRARMETGIARGSVSVASIGATLVSSFFTELHTRHGVVLGAGETGQVVIKQLQSRGLQQVTIANRTYQKAQDVAKTAEAHAAALEEINRLLVEADLVVCATGAPHPIITEAITAAAMLERPDRPLVLLDLCRPRNISPGVAAVPGVQLYALDALDKLAEDNRRQREAEVVKVEELIEAEVSRISPVSGANDTQRLVAALHRRAEKVRQTHVERYGRYFDDHHREHLEKFSAGLTRSVLFELTQHLRSLNLETEEGRAQHRMIMELFQLATDSAATCPHQ